MLFLKFHAILDHDHQFFSMIYLDALLFFTLVLFEVLLVHG